MGADRLVGGAIRYVDLFDRGCKAAVQMTSQGFEVGRGGVDAELSLGYFDDLAGQLVYQLVAVGVAERANHCRGDFLHERVVAQGLADLFNGVEVFDGVEPGVDRVNCCLELSVDRSVDERRQAEGQHQPCARFVGGEGRDENVCSAHRNGGAGDDLLHVAGVEAGVVQCVEVVGRFLYGVEGAALHHVRDYATVDERTVVADASLETADAGFDLVHALCGTDGGVVQRLRPAVQFAEAWRYGGRRGGGLREHGVRGASGQHQAESESGHALTQHGIGTP